jgi:YHS domain-containing protein
MKTLICRTCGCSLVRLGISSADASKRRHDGEEHFFCCQGCADLFATDPERYLAETSDLIVCPTCLAEKPMKWAVTLTISGQDTHFCRCPYCAEVFQKNPDFYVQRLEGTVPHKGVFGHEACCVRPE